MEYQIVAVSLTPEITHLLADNDLDLLSHLQEAGLDVRRPDAAIELADNAAGRKSVALIILASAASVPLVASGIARIIDAVGRNRRAAISQTETPLPKKAAANISSSAHKLKASFLGLKVELTDKFAERR